MLSAHSHKSTPNIHWIALASACLQIVQFDTRLSLDVFYLVFIQSDAKCLRKSFSECTVAESASFSSTFAQMHF